MDCSLPDFSSMGLFQARRLEWVAISFSRGSSPPRDQTPVSCTAGRHFTIWGTGAARVGWQSSKTQKALWPVWKPPLLSLRRTGQGEAESEGCSRDTRRAPCLVWLRGASVRETCKFLKAFFWEVRWKRARRAPMILGCTCKQSSASVKTVLVFWGVCTQTYFPSRVSAFDLWWGHPAFSPGTN